MKEANSTLKEYEPLFTIQNLKSIEIVSSGLDKMLQEATEIYNASVADRENRLAIKVANNKGSKSKDLLNSVNMYNKKADLAYKLITEYVEYAKNYNITFQNVKEDLLQKDHSVVDKAIYNLLFADYNNDQLNYNNISSTYKAMVLIKHWWKKDSPLMEVATKCFKSAQQNRETLKQARKYLYKTPAQIAGFRRIAASMRNRWGEF
ncbi:MAG: hypothetical protein ABIP51_18135 [Bacteroidia bacterium]